MPLQRRIPKFGFKNRFRVSYRPVNVARLAELVEAGTLDAGAITPEALVAAGVVGKNDRVKILGGGELSTALTVTAHAFSGSARSKIEAAGGQANVLA